MFGHLVEARVLKLVGYSSALTLLALIAYVVYQLFFSPLRSYPGPWLNAVTPIPFLYNLLSGNQCQYFEDLHNEYGEVVRVTPNQLSYATADAWKDIYERRPSHNLLEKEPNFYVHPGDNVPSIVTAPRNIHIRMRRLYSHAFSEKALRDQVPLINVYVDLLMRRLAQESAKGNAVDIVRYYNWTAFDIIGDLALGEPFGCLKEGSDHPWIEATFASIKVAPMAFVGACVPSIGPYMRSLLPPSIAKDLAENFQFTTDKVRARLERKTDRADFMSRIIEHNDANGMTGAEIESTSNHVIIGGGETTATALAGMTFNLLNNDHAMAKLKKEIRESFPSVEEITMTRLSELPYMAAVINESLRLYPPFAGSFPRIVPPEGEVILGKPVPGKTVVSVHHWATYHNKKNFFRPEAFVPERFLGDPTFETDSKKSLQPFLVGPRACIGKNSRLPCRRPPRTRLIPVSLSARTATGIPTAAAGAPNAPRTATARLRGTAAPPPATTATKRARPPTADSSTLASSPLRRPTNDIIVVSESPQRSPTKRSRTAAETPLAAPSTPPGRDTVPTTPPTPSRTAKIRATRPAITPHTTHVPEDVARICGIADGHADALTAALAIVYEADHLTGAAVDAILQQLFYRHVPSPPPPPRDYYPRVRK